MSSDRERAREFVNTYFVGVDMVVPLAAEFAAVREPYEARIATLEAAVRDERSLRMSLSVLANERRCPACGTRRGHPHTADCQYDAIDKRTTAALSGAGAADHDERVRAEEREACARLVENFVTVSSCEPLVMDGPQYPSHTAAVAAAVRARGAK